MIYKKAEKRIDAIMAQLKGRMTHELDISRNLVWRTASTKETYGDVPAGEELKWKRIPGFPFEYGRPWTNFWFSCSVDCEEMAKERDEDLYLELLTETDTMVYLDGKPQGATNPFHPLLKLNPLTPAVVNIRNIFLKGLPPDWTQIFLYYLIGIAVFQAGYCFFSAMRRRFADVV